MFNNLGGTNLTWLLVLLLLIGDNENCMGLSCDTLIWLLLLSRSCGDNGNGCGCGNQNRPCGCSAM